MDLKSLILNPEKETISLIHLDGQQVGYFLLGKNKISFFGDKMPTSLPKTKEQMCISIEITDNTAYLDDFFLLQDKIDCTELDSSIFFKLFDVVLPEIGMNEFKLVDESYISLNNCSWVLLNVGFFIKGRTYYEKYGFTNDDHTTPDAKERIVELRNTTTLNDLYLNDPDRLKEIYDELIVDNDNYKEMLLKDFILNYVKPACELNYNRKKYDILETILNDITEFLHENGFYDSWFRKYYPVVEDKLKPDIVIIEPEDEDEVKNKKIKTRSNGGGRRKNKIYKNKIYKKKTKKNYKNYKKKTNRRRTINKYKR